MPSLTVITPSWGRPEGLIRLAISIKEQDYDPAYLHVEWLIGLDGAKPIDLETIAAIKIILKDSFVSVSAWAFSLRVGKPLIDNFLLHKSTGSFVTWVDSDDFFTGLAFQSFSIAIDDHKNNDVAYLFLNKQTTGRIVTHVIGSIDVLDGPEYFRNVSGDGTLLVPRLMLHNNFFPEVDFIVHEFAFWKNVLWNKKIRIMRKVVKIMDRSYKNSVSHGSGIKYSYGYCYAFSTNFSDGTRNLSEISFLNWCHFYRHALHSNFECGFIRLYCPRFYLVRLIGFTFHCVDIVMRRVEHTRDEFIENRKKYSVNKIT